MCQSNQLTCITKTNCQTLLKIENKKAFVKSI